MAETIKRIQTGVRMEPTMVKVLKGLAELYDISLGALIEGIVLHSFSGETPFDEKMIKKIDTFKELYDMDYGIERCKKIHNGD